MKMKNNVRLLVMCGLLIALDVVSARFLNFYTPGQTDRISLQFLANAFAGMLFGPVWGALTCVLGDVVGMAINPNGMFMPLITLACAARGVIYGLVLHKKPVSILRSIVAVSVVTVVVELGMMPVFLSVLYGRAWGVLLIAKLPWRLATIPVYGMILYTVSRAAASAGIVKSIVRGKDKARG